MSRCWIQAGERTMTLDPAIARIVEAMGEAPNVDLEQLNPDHALAIARAWSGAAAAPPPPGSEDFMIAGYKGDEIRLRLYFPDKRNALLPVLMYLHGGGFVSGSIGDDDTRCAKLARDAHCIVASVDYRLAPEHQFPAALEDAFAAWLWLTSEAAQYGGDPRRMAISGSSAGGHIAIGVCRLALSRGAILPLLQLLTYPVVDATLETGSYCELADGPFLTKARMAWYWKQYVGDPIDHSNPLIATMAATATGLPPAHVITAEYDVLRDEGETYADWLRAAGIAATAERYPGMIHGFLSVAPEHSQSLAALERCADALRWAFTNR
jgi:acetyl esterase